MAGSSRGPRGTKRTSCLGGRLFFGPRDDARAQGMVPREDTVVPHGVGTGRWNQGAESSEEGVRCHLGVGGPGAGGLLEVDADLTVRGALDPGRTAAGGGSDTAARVDSGRDRPR